MFLVLFLISSACGYERLSTNAFPKKYHLTIHPRLEPDYIFNGTLVIQMILNQTSTFSLDCENLNVTSTNLSYENENQPHTADQDANRLIVKSSKLFNGGIFEVVFSLRFYGHIRQDLAGFYFSSYEYAGKKRILGSTQFESSGARKAFPCFDEPSFRANFSLTIEVDRALGAISNTPIISNDVRGDLRRIEFEERPSIPTYLVAWIIYDPESFGDTVKNVTTNCTQNSSLDYSIWYDKTYVNETGLALNAAPNITSALENFTGIQCKAVKNKMDLVAIPDFQAGAMENWEIITFRESALLYNNISSTAFDKQSIIMIVAHELTHQWFGNLVTPQWWSYTWLNEGFARYLQYVIADELYPEMKLLEQFLVDRRQIALQTDGTNAHPLTNENITSEDAISDMFDIITYDKGASVIHMWRSTIGFDEFKARINKYLMNVERDGGVSKPEYLFSALFDNTAYNNKALGKTWTEQNGYPIVVVTESNSSITLNQIRVTGWNITKEGNWMIPITININNTFRSYNMEPNNSLTIPYDQASPYIINSNQTGFYRVMYTNIKRWIPMHDMTDLTRSMLIDDALAHSKAGILPYDISMMVASHHLKWSTGYLPWVSGLRAFSAIHDVLKNTEFEQKWKRLVLDLMNGVMEKIALNDSIPENHILLLHKINLLRHGCNYGHEGCLNEANKLASNLSYGSPEKRSALLCTVVRQGNNSIWNQIYTQYNFSTSPQEKQLYLKALTCSLDRPTIQKLLQLTLTSIIRKQDVTATFAAICESPVGAEETLEFLKNNLSALYNYFGGVRNIKKILSSATKFINESQLAQIKPMASVLPELKMDSIIENIQRSINLKNNDIQMISDYLLSNNQTITTEHSKGEVTTESSNKETTENSNSSSSKINVEKAWAFSILTIYVVNIVWFNLK